MTRFRYIVDFKHRAPEKSRIDSRFFWEEEEQGSGRMFFVQKN